MIALWALVGLLTPAAGDVDTVPLEGVARLERVTAALRALEAGEVRRRVRVTHLGDSHIVADLWTAPLRAALQARYGDGGRGYVLPGRPWSSYRQAHVSGATEGRWRVDGMRGGLDDGRAGPAGCTMASSDPSAAVHIGTPARTAAGTGFTRLDVHFLRQPGGGCLDVLVDDVVRGRVSTRGPWPTPGFADLAVPPGPHAVTLRPLGGGEARLLGVSMENPDGVIYDALGINGAQANRLLREDPTAQAAVLRRLRPDLVILSFGANELYDPRLSEERYRADLDRLLVRVRVAVPGADCLLTGPPDMLRAGRPPPLVEEVYAAQRQAADLHGCAFWDARAAMGGPGAIRRWRQQGMAQKDFVHLTRRGYDRLAEALLVALLDVFGPEPGEAGPAAGRGERGRRR